MLTTPGTEGGINRLYLSVWVDELPPEERAPDSQQRVADEETSFSEDRNAGLEESLFNFYSIHNPSMVSHVQAIAKSYCHRQEVLFESLEEKYGVRPS